MTGISAIPPGLPLILGALLLPWFGPRLRAVLVLGLPLLALALIWQVPDGVALRVAFLDHELLPVNGDRLSRLFATVFAIMAFAGGLFALNRSRVVELVAALICAGSAIGVTFAGDLITLVVFWEVLALASTLMEVACDVEPDPMRTHAGRGYGSLNGVSGYFAEWTMVDGGNGKNKDAMRIRILDPNGAAIHDIGGNVTGNLRVGE